MSQSKGTSDDFFEDDQTSLEVSVRNIQLLHFGLSFFSLNLLFFAFLHFLSLTWKKESWATMR